MAEAKGEEDARVVSGHSGYVTPATYSCLFSNVGCVLTIACVRTLLVCLLCLLQSRWETDSQWQRRLHRENLAGFDWDLQGNPERALRSVRFFFFQFCRLSIFPGLVCFVG